MTEDELRIECRNILTLLDISVLPGRMDATHELMIFAKRQQAEGRQDEHERWVKKFPSASPPQGGGAG